MLGTSKGEYVFVRVCIFLLDGVAPVCMLYCAIIAACPTFPFRLGTTFDLWATAETLFWILFFLPYRQYCQRTTFPPIAPSQEIRRTLMNQVKSEVADPEAFIRGWFKCADIEDIGRQHVEQWVAWAFFGQALEQVVGEKVEADEIEEYVCELERLLKRKFRPGKGTARPIRLTEDPVDMKRRSLLWYTCVGLIDLLTCINLRSCGFILHRLSLPRCLLLFPFRPWSLLASRRSPAVHTSYWYRPHTSTTRLPVLFIHGIGIGLYPYADFLSRIDLAETSSETDPDDQIGVLAIEIMPVSFRITHNALDREQFCAELRQILDSHSWDRFVMASHSYGSVFSTFVVADPNLRSRVTSLLLVDPVTFLLHTPDVAYNFTVRKPRRANEWQLWYFASKDPGVAYTLGRRFFWTTKVMWQTDLAALIHEGKRLTISLAGRDLIINAEAVRRCLEGGTTFLHNTRVGPKGSKERGDNVVQFVQAGQSCSRPDILWFGPLDHGQVFDDMRAKEALAAVLRRYCINASD